MSRRILSATIGASLALVSVAVLATPAAAATSRSLTLYASPQKVAAGKPVVLSGTLSRSPKGTKVSLQRLTKGAWVSFASVKTASTGTFTSKPIASSVVGKTSYRAYAPATKKLRKATSSTRSVTVTTRPFTTVPTPVVSGTPRVRQQLTAQTTGWAPTPSSFTYQWHRDGQPIAGATAKTYVATEADLGASISVTVSARRSLYTTTPSPSAGTTIAPATFGDLMKPYSDKVAPSSVATFTTAHLTPPIGPYGVFTKSVRWDDAEQNDVFTHSLEPEAAFAWYSDPTHERGSLAQPAMGADYVHGVSILKNADVEFRVTGKKFAIRYASANTDDAMVWIDGRPLAASPIPSTGDESTQYYGHNWIIVTLPERKTVDVRFAGPHVFTGVDYDLRDPVTLAKTPERFSVGVVSNSFYESSASPASHSRSAAPVLSTLTGFQVRNMTETATGYINAGTGSPTAGVGYPGFVSSPFGSESRLDYLEAAPIDALIVSGSINDSPWTPAQQLVAVDAYLDAVAARRPDLPVVLVGMEPLHHGIPDEPSPRTVAMNDNIRQMAQEHDNVVGFVDPYTERWLTGTGSTEDPHGDGNQDLYVGADGLHLNGAGQVYYQGRLVDALKSLSSALVPPG